MEEQRARGMVCLPLDGINHLRKRDAPRGEVSIESRVEELSPVVGLFKVGKESYTRFGPQAVEVVQNLGSDVFLDLKYHDIPNTVKGAARAASELQVYMLNVHASGGIEMMEAAVEGANSISTSGARIPMIIGVTVLTSLDQGAMNNELRIPGSVEDQVLHLAKNASRAGLHGIVCSAADLYFVKDRLHEGFMYVTPGIKGPNTEAGADQKRVFTPGNAVQDGSSILVIGRAITDPRTEAQKEEDIIITPEMRIQAGYEVLQDMAKYL